MKFIELKTAELAAATAQHKEQQKIVAAMAKTHQAARDALDAFEGDKSSRNAEHLVYAMNDAAADKSFAESKLSEIDRQISHLRNLLDAPENLKKARDRLKELLASKDRLAEKMERITGRISETDVGIEAANAVAARGLKEAAQRLVDEADSVVAEMVATKPVGFDLSGLQTLRGELQAMAEGIVANQAELDSAIEEEKRHIRRLLNDLAEIDYQDLLISITPTLARVLAARMFNGNASGRRLELQVDIPDEALRPHLDSLAASLAP